MLIVGAAAEIVMFCALIFFYGLTLQKICYGYLYIFALMSFYLAVMKIFKSNTAALILSLFATFIPFCSFIYTTANAVYFAAALFCFLSFFIYTLTQAEGLKHNQDKFFLVFSLILYGIAAYFSSYSVLLLLLVIFYAIFISKKTFSLFNLSVFLSIFIMIFILKNLSV